ncbi:MAG: carboxymuconolactone decarboxylase family protein [Phycisphaerae bacterium]|jgi:alkylhydroperoxidase/carboxymuconolactone decarboxylase family protein YurZ|nr:carboxymuconolactone decarboxylase family protein [Phycisphaerae bacterium]
MLPQQKKAFGEFYKSANKNGILDDKTTLMIHLAAAMALGCYPCMEHYLAQTDKTGLSADEISAVQAIVMAVSAGKVNAQLQDVRKKDSSCCDDTTCG